MNKRYFLVILLLVIFSISSCKREVSNNPEGTKVEEIGLVPVTAIKAQLSNYYEYGEYYGRTQGVSRASIINILGGTVEAVTVTEGTVVKKGDSLGKISPRSAQIALESAILNEKISGDNYNTLKNFLKSGNSTPKNVDEAKLAWLSSQSQLINAQKAYDAAFCISPIDGVVVSRNINIDDEVAQGKNTFLIEDLTQLEIQIGIPEADMDGIAVGSSADITFDLYPGRVWEGKLTRFSRRSSDSNLTFSATLVFDNSDGTILSGITAKVKLLRNSYENYIVLPNNAVVNENGNNYVMVLNNGVVHKRDVLLGVSNVDKCVVISGIDEGEILIEEGIHLLIDNQEVRVINQGDLND